MAVRKQSDVLEQQLSEKCIVSTSMQQDENTMQIYTLAACIYLYVMTSENERHHLHVKSHQVCAANLVYVGCKSQPASNLCSFVLVLHSRQILQPLSHLNLKLICTCTEITS